MRSTAEAAQTGLARNGDAQRRQGTFVTPARFFGGLSGAQVVSLIEQNRLRNALKKEDWSAHLQAFETTRQSGNCTPLA